jgi:hypothetical protein
VNLYAIHSACEKYARANGGDLPKSLRELDGGFEVCGRRVVNALRCPGREERGALEALPLPGDATTYVYVTGLRLSDPGHYIVAFDEPQNHAECAGDGSTPCNALYLSGVVCPLDKDMIPGYLRDQLAELRSRGRSAGIAGEYTLDVHGIDTPPDGPTDDGPAAAVPTSANGD